MTKRIFIAIIIGLFITTAISTFFIISTTEKPIVIIEHIESMPIVRDDPYVHLTHGGNPVEQRDEQFRKWLAVSLKIAVSNASGSGTIIYYENKYNYAYIQSCGHLWHGNMNAKENRKLTCNVITWYQNEKKLPSPKTYPAEVLYYSNIRGKDCSLLRFKPDWIPEFMPLGPANSPLPSRLHSCGCDGGREVAHYDVKYLGTNNGDLITTENSPRPGRSGGGLMTTALFVGVCWGTTDVSGNGNGFFTPLDVVRKLNEDNGFGFLNEIGNNIARLIPIIDRNNPQQQYPHDYIPLPQR